MIEISNQEFFVEYFLQYFLRKHNREKLAIFISHFNDENMLKFIVDKFMKLYKYDLALEGQKRIIEMNPSEQNIKVIENILIEQKRHNTRKILP